MGTLALDRPGDRTVGGHKNEYCLLQKDWIQMNAPPINEIEFQVQRIREVFNWQLLRFEELLKLRQASHDGDGEWAFWRVFGRGDVRNSSPKLPIQTFAPLVPPDQLSQEMIKDANVFRIVIAYLLSSEGRLEIPPDQLAGLWRFSCYAPKIENYFTRKGDDSLSLSYTGPYLLRRIFTILDRWSSFTAIRNLNEGAMQYELDYHIFKFFVVQAELHDQLELFRIAHEDCAIFRGENWPTPEALLKAVGSNGSISKYSSPKNRAGRSLRSYKEQDVIFMCYGNP